MPDQLDVTSTALTVLTTVVGASVGLTSIVARSPCSSCRWRPGRLGAATCASGTGRESQGGAGRARRHARLLVLASASGRVSGHGPEPRRHRLRVLLAPAPCSSSCPRPGPVHRMRPVAVAALVSRAGRESLRRVDALASSGRARSRRRRDPVLVAEPPRIRRALPPAPGAVQALDARGSSPGHGRGTASSCSRMPSATSSRTARR